MRREIIIETIFAISLFLIISTATYATQKQITYNQGKGWDGAIYYALVEQMTKGESLSADAPFLYRVGTPYLASLIPGDEIFLKFKIINLIACVISIGLLSIWFRLYISNLRIRMVLMLLFISQWLGPVRFTYFYPHTTDPWVYVFVLAGLILIHKSESGSMFLNTLAISILSFVGVMFREVILAIPVTWWYVRNAEPISDLLRGNKYLEGQSEGGVFSAIFKKVLRLGRRGLLPLFASIVSLIVVKAITHKTNNYQFLKFAIEVIYEKPILTYLHAWFITFGPILVLPLCNLKLVKAFTLKHPFHIVFLFIIAVLAWVGGSDTERYVYWGMPVVYVIIGMALTDKIEILKRSPLLVFFLLFMQCLSQRIFWVIPDFQVHPQGNETNVIFLTVIGNSVNYLDLFSFHSRLIVKVISLSQYIIVGMALLAWLKYREARLSHLTNVNQDSPTPFTGTSLK